MFAVRELVQTVALAIAAFWQALNLRGAWRAMDLRRRLTVWWRVVTGEDYWQTHLEEATDA